MTEDKLVVSGDVLADILNLSRARITQMVQDGMPKHSRGRYAIRECVRWYIDRKLTTTSKAGDLNEARRELYVSQKEKTDLETARVRREVIDANEVAAAVNQLSSIFASQMEAIGGRLASEIAHVDDPAVVLKRITEETRQVRAAVAEHVNTFADSIDSSGDHQPAT